MADGGTGVLTAILVAAMVVPLLVLGVVGWIFLRAKRREDAIKKELEWRKERLS
jgi:hypothetical protein